jgi:hypothetical protein
MSAASHNGPAGTTELRSYHGRPVLKEPVWTAEVPIYFYFGGLAGVSAGLAYLSGLRGEELLARRAWATALGGLTVSPALLISDLGRPERFLNMLRMFKVTSPMSVGSWVLSGSGAATAVAAIHSWTGAFPRTARLARPVAALLGLPLSTYTAALLANTAVPVWHEARRELPFVFASGAALSAGAAGVMTTAPENAGPARRLAVGAAVVELGVTQLMERRLVAHGDPYREGSASRFARVARGCIVAGATLLQLRGRRSRPAAVASGALLTAGALSTRGSVFKAGIQSAADPKYVIGPQREAIDAGRRTGAARRESRIAVADPEAGSPASLS